MQSLGAQLFHQTLVHRWRHSRKLLSNTPRRLCQNGSKLVHVVLRCEGDVDRPCATRVALYGQSEGDVDRPCAARVALYGQSCLVVCVWGAMTIAHMRQGPLCIVIRVWLWVHGAMSIAHLRKRFSLCLV